MYIEQLHPFYSQEVVYNDTTFEISCTASGSNIEKVTWYKDDQPLEEEYFNISRLETVDGYFEYEQTRAVRSVVRRKPESKLTPRFTFTSLFILICRGTV